jgi:hypothetical protein
MAENSSYGASSSRDKLRIFLLLFILPKSGHFKKPFLMLTGADLAAVVIGTSSEAMVVESCSGAEAVEMLKALVAVLHEEADSVVVGIGRSSGMVVENCRGKEAVQILMLVASLSGEHLAVYVLEVRVENIGEVGVKNRS